MPDIEGKCLLFGVLLHYLDRTHGDGVADLDVAELILAGGQSRVQQHRIRTGLAVIHPVAVLDYLDRLFRGAQFLFVFFINIHNNTLLFIQGMCPKDTFPALFSS